MTKEAAERSFDELASALASGTLSRGKALRLMGAALVGGVLASIPGIAEAAPALKPGGRKCRSDSQCESRLCLPSGVCSGFPSGRKASRICPEGCLPVVLEDGSIGCYSCPSGSCEVHLVRDCSSTNCAPGNLCVPYQPPGDPFPYACLPPCTAG
jgi:hypothetical protein